MKRLVTSKDKLSVPAKPLEFITNTGIDKTEGEEIISCLKEYLDKHPDVIAITAPQLGFDKRIFCIRFSDVIKTFINPIITKKTGMKICVERNISFSDNEFIIGRPTEITAVYYNDSFKYEDNKFIDPVASIFDQNAQLLDGVLPFDLGLVSSISEDGPIEDLSKEEFNEVIAMYKQFIATKSTTAVNEINTSDETSKKIFNKMKFSEDVINGRTQIIEDTPPTNREQRRKLNKINKSINKLKNKED